MFYHRFIYHLNKPKNAVALGPNGPHALDHQSTGMIARFGRPQIIANTTVPPPYTFFLRPLLTSAYLHTNITATGGPQQQPIVVFTSAKALSGSASVTQVYPYSPAVNYGVGDVLDVVVAFSRPVFTTGTPQLLLQGSSQPSNRTTSLVLTATNVSFIQVRSKTTTTTTHPRTPSRSQ